MKSDLWSFLINRIRVSKGLNFPDGLFCIRIDLSHCFVRVVMIHYLFPMCFWFWRMFSGIVSDQSKHAYYNIADHKHSDDSCQYIFGSMQYPFDHMMQDGIQIFEPDDSGKSPEKAV